ncbi:MAG: DUF1624 domain-containing protein [Methanomicrobium sp.]|nr:DUF1624 domain-containing protein [Methanomicrobium sp.]
MIAENILNKCRLTPEGSAGAPSASKTASRYFEIDIIRGIAVIIMILFHFLFDLNYFAIMPVNTATGFWRILGYATAITFVAVAGISAYISNERAKQRLTPDKCLYKSLKRGFFIFMLGVGISIVTFLVIGDGWIVFGILHLIGLSIMLSPIFMCFKTYNLIFGAVVIAAGLFIREIQFNITQPILSPLLIPLGITPESFYSVDYEPLLPWFGVFLIGIAVAAYLYPQGMRRSGRFSDIAGKISANTGTTAENSASRAGIFCAPVLFLGQNSLIVYLIHQPVIILLLSICAGHLLL